MQLVAQILVSWCVSQVPASDLCWHLNCLHCTVQDPVQLSIWKVCSGQQHRLWDHAEIHVSISKSLQFKYVSLRSFMEYQQSGFPEYFSFNLLHDFVQINLFG